MSGTSYLVETLINHHQREHSPLRMQAVFAAVRLAVAGEFEVQGLENLGLIEREEPVVVATSHHTDVDVPLAAHAIAKRIDLAVTNMSVLQYPHTDLITWLGITIGGSKNFLPISYEQEGKIQRPSSFNPDNFTEMVKVINRGKRVLMAAYSPYKNRNDKAIRPGIGVPYLASLTGARILPVEVTLRDSRNLALSETMTKTILTRPDFTVTVGQPFNLSRLPDSIEQQGITSTKLALREQGQEVLAKLESLKQ